MGMLVDGKWTTKWYDTSKTSGRFVRKAAQFRNWIEDAEGAAHPAEAGRYHLYVSHACPWCHRTMIVRALEGLQDIVGVSVVNHFMGDDGWTFEPGPGVIADPVFGARYAHEIYTAADPDYTGRVTVPILWDTVAGTMVSNESEEICRMFDVAFDRLKGPGPALYPGPLQSEINALNERIYQTVNNGVYRCGFATTQHAYEEAYAELFATLDMLDERLATRRYLAGAHLTEADIRLYVTLIRFDAVYYGHFKCNRQRISDFEHLSGYLRDVHQHPGVADTLDLGHIKQHYYGSHETVNPTRIVPLGPRLDFDSAPNRAHLP